MFTVQQRGNVLCLENTFTFTVTKHRQCYCLTILCLLKRADFCDELVMPGCSGDKKLCLRVKMTTHSKAQHITLRCQLRWNGSPVTVGVMWDWKKWHPIRKKTSRGLTPDSWSHWICHRHTRTHTYLFCCFPLSYHPAVVSVFQHVCLCRTCSRASALLWCDHFNLFCIMGWCQASSLLELKLIRTWLYYDIRHPYQWDKVR